ncbi:tetratricopeptide repeat protein [Dictyobacter formicarum]|uniref:Tetratricopeptide repeat protein n=1 Tax=Dictyobacter formicarum TaxID=2778368 RepID=A0ABQ3VCL9_9CHLR|nr:tetratricopeptide repeat protein [Dictyobacter formicarum]GHO83710.1 hypothetical protein KSZ_17160 [Dictyobacter formicarum]
MTGENYSNDQSALPENFKFLSTLIQQKHYEEALAACEQALQLEPDNAQLYQLKGELLAQRFDNPVGALEAFELALQLKPDNATTWKDKSHALWQLKLHAEALEAAEQAILHDPHNARAYYYKGLCLAEMYQETEALAAFEQAIQLDPDEPDPYYMQNNVLRDLARFEEAHAAFEAGANAAQHRRTYVITHFRQRVEAGQLDNTIELGIQLFRGGSPEKWVDEKYALSGDGYARLEREDRRQQLARHTTLQKIEPDMCNTLFTLASTTVPQLIEQPRKQDWDTAIFECRIHLSAAGQSTALMFEVQEQEIEQGTLPIVEAIKHFRALDAAKR